MILAKIQDNNSKGVGPNVSLMPIRDCVLGVPCAKRGECYACKFLFRPSVKNCWDHNSNLFASNPKGFFNSVSDYCTKKRPEFFRWLVAGDIKNARFLRGMISVAKRHPSTKFLAFTKNHRLDYSNLPSNLTIIASMWPGWGNPNAPKIANLRKAWMQDGTETRVPSNAIHCPGRCDNCGLCWSLNSIGRDVYFSKH